MNVESFNLDHRAVQAPYVRIAETRELPGGDAFVKYDLRFCQPNVDHLAMPVVHSLEHMMAEHMRNYSDVVIDISPMGCQTGFYALLVGTPYEEFLPLLAKTLHDVAAATEVPAANEVQCGWGASHDLAGARQAARAFLDRRAEWGQVLA